MCTAPKRTRLLFGMEIADEPLCSKLERYVLTEEQLRRNGYPLPNLSIPGRAEIRWNTFFHTIPNMTGSLKKCTRCEHLFSMTVDEDGRKKVDGGSVCVYHWASPSKKRGTRYGRFHQCCNGREGSKGCQISTDHVHKVNKYTDCDGFVETREPVNEGESSSGKGEHHLEKKDQSKDLKTDQLELEDAEKEDNNIPEKKKKTANSELGDHQKEEPHTAEKTGQSEPAKELQSDPERKDESKSPKDDMSNSKKEDLNMLLGKKEVGKMVFALDCEMIYTVAGMELARVTVVADKEKVVYDSVVKPSTPIIDYNTRFSGMTSKDFEGVSTSLQDVQEHLLSMISPRSILIGHSLEGDLITLKLIHRRVIDTSVVFPHPDGPPKKRALRYITQDVLFKTIQQAGAGGHDSAEDARSCMQLMKRKVQSTGW